MESSPTCDSTSGVVDVRDNNPGSSSALALSNDLTKTAEGSVRFYDRPAGTNIEDYGQRGNNNSLAHTERTQGTGTRDNLEARLWTSPLMIRL